jgi:hypothetical protein
MRRAEVALRLAEKNVNRLQIELEAAGVVSNDLSAQRDRLEPLEESLDDMVKRLDETLDMIRSLRIGPAA